MSLFVKKYHVGYLPSKVESGAVIDTVGVWEGLVVGFDGIVVGPPVGFDGIKLGTSDGLSEGPIDAWFILGIELGITVFIFIEGSGVVYNIGLTEGLVSMDEGLFVWLAGLVEGFFDEAAEGFIVDSADGSTDGSADGSAVGSTDGSADGSAVGSADGSADGSMDGCDFMKENKIDVNVVDGSILGSVSKDENA